MRYRDQSVPGLSATNTSSHDSYHAARALRAMGVRTVAITDCKSLYDHLHASGVTAVEDRENVLDLLITRDIAARLDVGL